MLWLTRDGRVARAAAHPVASCIAAARAHRRDLRVSWRADSSSRASSEHDVVVHLRRGDHRPLAKRAGIVASVKSAGLQSSISSHDSGAETRASGRRPHRIRCRNGAILGVLVVVEKDAVPLFLPPLARGDRWCAALDFAREGQRRATHLDRTSSVARSARRRGCLASPRSSASRRGPGPERRAHDTRHLRHLRPLDARHRIQIDTQLVWMIEIFRADRMRMQLEAGEVRHPGEGRGISRHHLVCGAAGGKRQRDHVDPWRTRFRRTLLKEELS